MDQPEHQANLTDLLIGRIFDSSVGQVFEDLDPWLSRRRQEADTPQVA